MSARDERQKAVLEHKKFLEDNTKDEQARYDKARAESQNQEKILADIITQVNLAKAELDPLKKEKTELSNELLQAKNDLNETREKTSMLLLRLADKDRDFERRSESFSTYKKEQETEIEIKRSQIIELQHNVNKTLSEAGDKERSAINEREVANKKIAELDLKIAEYRLLSLKHDESKAETERKQAEIEAKNQKAENTLTEANKKEINLNSKEIAIIEREKNCDLRDKVHADKELELNLKEARLNKMQRDIDYLIETHNLKVK